MVKTPSTLPRYALRMFRKGQTHPVAYSTWHDDSRDELLRIANVNKDARFRMALYDRETGTVFNV